MESLSFNSTMWKQLDHIIVYLVGQSTFSVVDAANAGRDVGGVSYGVDGHIRSNPRGTFDWLAPFSSGNLFVDCFRATQQFVTSNTADIVNFT